MDEKNRLFAVKTKINGLKKCLKAVTTQKTCSPFLLSNCKCTFFTSKKNPFCQLMMHEFAFFALSFLFFNHFPKIYLSSQVGDKKENAGGRKEGEISANAKPINSVSRRHAHAISQPVWMLLYLPLV